MDKCSKYLYRALRKEEIFAGNKLIPKSQEPFQKRPALGFDTKLGWCVLGKTKEYAIRQHQCPQDESPTSGISTTPHLERAEYYAKKERIIVKINRQLFNKHSIEECDVNKCLEKFPEDIAKPEDNEIILVKKDGGSFPKEIIEEVMKII